MQVLCAVQKDIREQAIEHTLEVMDRFEEKAEVSAAWRLFFV